LYKADDNVPEAPPDGLRPRRPTGDPTLLRQSTTKTEKGGLGMPPGELYEIGDAVRVKNFDHEDWTVGKVTHVAPFKVKIPEFPGSFKFAFVERVRDLSSENYTAAKNASSLANDGWIADSYIFDSFILAPGHTRTLRKVTHLALREPRLLKQFPLDRSYTNPSAPLKEQAGLLAICCDHPNIITLHETFESKSHFYMLFEFCLGGTLFAHVSEYEGHTEQEVASVTQQLLRGLSHMHEKLIVHRDLRPEHIMLKNMGDLCSCEVKLIDFGAAKRMRCRGELMTDKVGTPYYSAPQVDNCRAEYTEKCDVWSAGVIMYLLLLSFPGYVRHKVHKRVQSFSASDICYGEFDFAQHDWAHCSKDCQEFLGSLLVRPENGRLSAYGAMQHAWIRKQSPHSPHTSVHTSMLE